MPMCKHITVNGSSHEIVALVSSVAPLGAGQAMTARVISRLESGHGGLVRVRVPVPVPVPVFMLLMATRFMAARFMAARFMAA